MLDMSLLVLKLKARTAWSNGTSYAHSFAELNWSAGFVCESSLLSLHQGLNFLENYLPDSAMAVFCCRAYHRFLLVKKIYVPNSAMMLYICLESQFFFCLL